ncbi:hypothetical protein [Euhalothece natronophila]|nr:hypothetical protein [Euhalothece natronophila]
MSKIEVTQSHYSDRILNRLKRALGLSAITALVLVSSTAVASDTMRVTGQQVRGIGSRGQLNGGKFEIPHGKTGTISQASSTGNGFWISKTDSQGVYQLLEQFRPPSSQAEGLTLSSGKYRALPNLQRNQRSARVELTIELK